MMVDYPQEKNVYSTASPPGYPAGAGAPFVPGASPQLGAQPGFAASPYAATPQQVPYQQTGTPQPQFVAQPGQSQFAQPGQPQFSPQPQVVVQPMMMQMGGRVQNLSQYAAPCLCPNCGQTAVTRVNFETSSYTHMWAIILGVVACCCCIPYMVDGMKDVRHQCGNCGVPLAVWHRSGGIEVLAHQAQVMPMQPQFTGAPTPGQIQPQFTGAPGQSPPAQYVQPNFTGPAKP